MAKRLVREKVPLQLMLDGVAVRASAPKGNERLGLLCAALIMQATLLRDSVAGDDQAKILENLVEVDALTETLARATGIDPASMASKREELDEDLGTWDKAFLLHGQGNREPKAPKAAPAAPAATRGPALANPTGRVITPPEPATTS